MSDSEGSADSPPDPQLVDSLDEAEKSSLDEPLVSNEETKVTGNTEENKENSDQEEDAQDPAALEAELFGSEDEEGVTAGEPVAPEGGSDERSPAAEDSDGAGGPAADQARAAADGDDDGRVERELFGDSGSSDAGSAAADGDMDMAAVDDEPTAGAERLERGEFEEEEEEGEEEDEEPEEKVINIEIPKVNTDLGRDINFVKLPNFLSVDTKAFDTATYEDELDETDLLDEEGRTRLKLKVENTMRWRYARAPDGSELRDEFGNPIRESNTRIVRWSDGTMSLHLGTEVFDVHSLLLQGDFNHLFVRQGNGLMGQAVFRNKLSFRPHSIDSVTHRKMTLSMADRSTRAQKIRVLPIVGVDPDAKRTELLKKEEEKLRASVRRESQQRRLRERSHSRGLSAAFLEEEEEEDNNENSISLSELKRKYKPGGAQRGGADVSARQIYSSSDSDSEPEPRPTPSRGRKPAANTSDSTAKKKKPKVLSDDDLDDLSD